MNSVAPAGKCEAFDRDFFPPDVNRKACRVCCLNGRLTLTVQSDSDDLRKNLHALMAISADLDFITGLYHGELLLDFLARVAIDSKGRSLTANGRYRKHNRNDQKLFFAIRPNEARHGRQR